MERRTITIPTMAKVSRILSENFRLIRESGGFKAPMIDPAFKALALIAV